MFPKSVEGPESFEGFVNGASTRVKCEQIERPLLFSALGCRAIATNLVWEGLDLSLGLWGALCVCSPGAQDPKSLSAMNVKIVSPHLPSPA